MLILRTTRPVAPSTRYFGTRVAVSATFTKQHTRQVGLPKTFRGGVSAFSLICHKSKPFHCVDITPKSLTNMIELTPWQKILPKSQGDRIALAFMMGSVHTIILFELFLILPAVHEGEPGHYWSHVLLGLFIYINLMGSIWYSLVTDTTSGSIILPSVLKPGWRFCSGCEGNAPPRSFHCWMCKCCILKRDHHCVFTGKCVGYSNHRYFINMVGYLCVGALYCNYLNVEYVWEILGGLSLTSLFTMFMPIFAWLFGLTETFKFSVAFISSTCVFGFLLLATLLVYHGINILNGQSTHERANGIREYNCGWKENMRQVFGVRWYISWFLPFVDSPLPGNGLEFPKKTSFENVKDM